MNGWLILTAVALPPLLLAALLATPLRRLATRLVPAAALPALAAALLAPEHAGDTVAPLVFSLRLGFDEAAAVLLVQVAVMWVLAGLHLARGRPFGRRFPVLCLLLTMVGSLGTIVALDKVSFYVFLSVMTVASYGLVETGRGRPEERRAARVYLTLALFGEFLALVAFLLAVSGAAAGPAYVWLLYFGIGSKLGVLPLHVALPLVYRAAPLVGAAVMGGVLLTSTAVGWLRFLPEGGEALAAASPVLLTIGLAAAFLGVLLGLFQRDARAALGYSTVSQMGLFTAFTAVAAAEPETWRTVLPVLAAFLVHHGFSKGGLLLAVGPTGAAAGLPGRIVVVVLSLALAAAPATGGAIAKLWIEEEVGRLPGVWHDMAVTVIPYTSAATALLMARIVWLAVRAEPHPAYGAATGWPAVLAAVAALVVPWQLVLAVHHEPVHLVLAGSHIWATVWPAALGLGLFVLATLAVRATGRRWPLIPAGDILVPLGRAWRAAGPMRAWERANRALSRGRHRVVFRTKRLTVALFRRLRYAERDFRDLRIIGTVFAGLIVGLTAATLLVR